MGTTNREYSLAFQTAMRVLVDIGYLEPCEYLEDGVWIGKATAQGAANASRELSKLLPGMVMPMGEGGGLLWQMGRNTAARVVPPDQLPAIRDAQRICEYLVPITPKYKKPWSLGGAALRLLLWVAPKAPRQFNADKFTLSDQFGYRDYQYHDCYPGRYDHVTQWDAKGYYWHIMARIPTLYITITPRGIIKHPMTIDQYARWGDLIRVLNPDWEGGGNPLYRSVWGAALGGNPNNPRLIYIDGVPGYIDMDPGPFRPAALLVCRAGSELCQTAAYEANSVYSTVDSVTTEKLSRPIAWSKYSIPIRPKFRGEAHIIARGVWSIGPHQTIPYKDENMRVPTPIDRNPALPTVLYHRLFL